jgi:membrane-associated phospholipid phosphatase
MSKVTATHHKPFTSFNPYFIIPFMIWIVLGGIAQLLFSPQQLFYFFNVHSSAVADWLMVNITLMGEGVFTVILLIVLFGIKSFRNWWYFLSAVLTNLLPVSIIQTIKYAVDAPRPLKYFNEALWIHTTPEWPRLMEHSFPSGHTSAAFCLFTFLGLLLPPRYRWLGLLFFILAISVAYSRMYLAAHFFADVYVGSIIGGIFTIGVIAVMNRLRSRFFTETIADATDN